ncbi:MAG: hypothetical protein ACI8Z1_001426 [Candidatus Azotimanducaceae bacterium]|jgi:hypothetical protein
MNCEQCEANLFHFHEGRLDAQASAAIDQHLKTCEDCSALLNDIWQMNLAASRWQADAPARRESMPEQAARSQWQLPNIVDTAASILALVLVLTDTRISADSYGIAIRFGPQDFVTADLLEALNQQQVDEFQTQINRITAQHVASDQLLLRSVLQANREERRDEFTSLVTLWSARQAKKVQETEDNFRYLSASQAEDEKDIRQLSAAFQGITLRQGPNM